METSPLSPLIGLSTMLRSLLVVSILILSACAHGAPQHRDLGLERFQFIGTHNAYHIEPDAALRVLWQASTQTEERLHETLMYTHQPLSAQAGLGIRFFELDVHLDSAGGRYAAGSFLAPMQAAGLQPDSAFDAEARLARPGTKVFHSTMDMRSTCLLLVECLTELRDWLAQNPESGPFIIQIEPKTLLDDDDGALRSWQSLEKDILAVIPVESMLRPVDLAYRPDELRQAAIGGRWPRTSELKDRFIFILNGSSRDTASYARALTAGRATVLFPALSDAEAPFAAFVSRNDPASDDIGKLVARGQMVITYADWRTHAARRNDTRGRDAAFRSGAQLIATDYPVPDRRLSDYSVRFPEGFVRRRPTAMGVEPEAKGR